MAQEHQTEEQSAEATLGRAVAKGVIIGLPVALIGLSLALFLFTDRGLVDSIVTALLPGVLLGAFGGGFAGMAATMD